MQPSIRRVPATIVIALASIAVTAVTGFGKSNLVSIFLIAEPGSIGFDSVMNGQVWRLITPILVHFSIIHIVFNLLWLWDLGRLVEIVRGTWYYVVFFLLVGIASNLAQFTLGQTVYFGGLSGVIYGLFGFVWIEGRVNPQFGFMHRNTVIMMLVWFALCWTGLLGPIANWAHTAGLVVGAIWGFADGKYRLSATQAR